MMPAVPGQPVPLLLDPQEDKMNTPAVSMIANNKIFFIIVGLFDCISIFASQIYKPFL
jgi:hypothetical protein